MSVGQGILHAVICIVGTLTIESHFRSHLVYETVQYLVASGRLKHATAHYAVGVYEFLSEVSVLQHVQEYGDEAYLCRYLWQPVIQLVEGVGVFPFERVERVRGAEGEVKVEGNEAELTVFGKSETFNVVLWPVCSAKVHHCRHVVGIFVNVNHELYLLVGVVIGSICRQVVPFHEVVYGALLLYISAVGAHLELVYQVVVPSVVGIDIMFVVRLTHI